MPDFSKAQYISFETYRKNGQAIATPIWFAIADSGEVYVYSLATAGKVKRVRNSGKSRIAVCDVRGKVLGEWVETSARIVTGEEVKLAETLLRKKYGILKRIGEWFGKIVKRERTVIAIRRIG